MNPTPADERPKARSQGLIVQELDSELMVYDETAQRAHCLNATAAQVWRYCDGSTTVAAMAARLGADAGAAVADDVVFLALSELGDRDLLERPVPGRGALNRRQVLVGLGATAGILLPMITSLTAPTSAAAQSGGGSSGTTSSGATSSGASSGEASTSSGATSSGASG